jgi:hypothetical protein
LAAPQYPELAVNLNALNIERGDTGFVIVDTPLRLSPDDVVTWATNNNGLGTTTSDGLLVGDAYTAAWYIGLITGPRIGTAFSASDTHASHAGWTEFTNYSGARKAPVLAAATLADPSVITNTASPASFTITGGGGVVGGAFLASVDSGTSGILFSESDFQSPGDRTVVSGDTLNVTYTFSLDAA